LALGDDHRGRKAFVFFLKGRGGPGWRFVERVEGTWGSLVSTLYSFPKN